MTGEGDSEPEATWQELGELVDGFAPENVKPLVAARELEAAYPLLHALTRGNVTSFFLRVAVLEAILDDGRAMLRPRDLAEVLYWLKERVRDWSVRTLRDHGWLDFHDGGYRVTDHGRFTATVLSFLRGQVREGSLVPTVESIDYMLRQHLDPRRQVVLLRGQLEDLRFRMEEALRSHSEVVLREAVSRLDDGLALSERIRAILAKVPLEMIESRRIAHEIHDLLSRLHGVGSDLHAAVTEVGRQYLHLVAGLTTTDVISTLMTLPAAELGSAGRDALRPVVVAPPLLLPELLAATAEAYLTRPRDQPEPVEWHELPPAEPATIESVIPAEAYALLDDLDRVVASGQPSRFAAAVPRGDAGETLLRVSLLPLLGQRTHGEGVAGRLGAFALDVIVEDGDLEPAPPLAGISPGDIRPRKAAR